MAFCGKCGKPVQDGAAFCASCGAPMNAAPQQPQYQQPQYQQPQYQQPQYRQPRQPGAPIAGGLVKLPNNPARWIGIFAIFVSFILLVSVHWYSIGGWTGRTVFVEDAFNGSVWFGFAKIFGIIAIVAFAVYFISYFINIKKLVPAIPFDLEKTSLICYLVCFALAIVFAFIAVLAMRGISFTAGYFITLVFFLIALVASLPGFLEKYMPALK